MERLAEMAEAVQQHLFSQADSDEKRNALSNFNVNAIVDSTYVFRAVDYVQQLSIVSVCPSLFPCYFDTHRFSLKTCYPLL